MATVVLMIALLAAGHIGTNAEKLDIAFVIDGSSTVCGPQSCPNWDYILQFICGIVSNLTIGPYNTKVAAVMSSDDVHVEWDFNKYTDKESLLVAIKNLVYPGGELNNIFIVKFLLTNVFVPTTGDRVEVQTVAISITDGTPNVDETIGLAESTLLQASLVKVLCVCVMPGCTEKYAKDSSSFPKQPDITYFLVPGYGSLNSVSGKLLKQLALLSS